jgi:hypothetical protein
VQLHKVRRLAGVLIASQLRSGRTTSDPKSPIGQPWIIGFVDLGAFLFTFLLSEAVVRGSNMSSDAWRLLLQGLLPFLPLAAVGVVLIAGVSFELTANARFAGSDAANWMPVTSREFVAASASAIAYTYSPAIALVLGAALPPAAPAGLLPAYVLTFGLCLVSLFEGAFLVEMLRAASNRVGSAGSGRRGAATIVLRALVLVVVILALDLALNPLILLGAVHGLSALPTLSIAIPLFWSTAALAAAVAGGLTLAALLATGQVVFVVLLAALAAELRRRYWVPTPLEIRLGEHAYAPAHPVLSAMGLDRAESALVGKDLRGFVRRRELLPLLVIPIVLIVLLGIEGSGFGAFGLVLWVGWVGGLFGLLLASTALGQERRALQLLFAFPLTPRAVFRAKATASLIPVLIGSVAMTVAVGLWFRFPYPLFAGTVVITSVAAVVLVFWGLVFAGRYSDFQDRPRPQFVRPGPMIAATFSGLALLGAIVVPAAWALADPSSISGLLVGLATAIAAVVGGVAFLLARSGFDRLFRELPF